MNIKIFDTTLRDGEQSPGFSMNLTEKVEMALQLEQLGVDIIEAGFAIASAGDFKAVSEISKIIKNSTIASLARTSKKDIDTAYEAVKLAKYPRIHTFIATSDIHMKYKLKKSEEEVTEIAREMVKYAKKLCYDIEFSAEDASRTRPEFLYYILEEVIKAGATVVNIPDTVGYTTPQEYLKLISGIKENVRGINNVDISVHCHDDLGLAVANSLLAIQAGATQVECTINGIGERAGNAALEEIVMNLYTRRDIYQCATNINAKEIYRTSKLLSTITGVRVQPNKAIVGENAFAHESGIHQHGILENKQTYEIITPESIGLTENKLVLGKHSGRHAFSERLKTLGFNLESSKIDEVFKTFKSLADKKKNISDRDIEAIVMCQTVQTTETYTLDRFTINSGNTITTTSSIRLNYNGEIIEQVESSYDGPIAASYKAIDILVGKTFILEDFIINAVTGGTDAQGEVNVRIKNKQGNSYNGHGISLDIVEASILAYISAINTMLDDEKTSN